MRVLSSAILLIPLLLAASAPAQRVGQPLEQKLKEAEADEAIAQAQTAKLENEVASARGEAARLRANELAAAQAIEAAEARITTADAQFRLTSAYVAASRERLANEQRPISWLLAGLAVNARRPPLLALVDGSGTDDLVKVSVLLDSTLPVIRSRTRGLSSELGEAEQLQAAAVSARAELMRSHQELSARRAQFAQLEEQALRRSLSAGGEALTTSDAAISAGEQVERLRGEEAGNRTALESARLLALEPPAPARPFRPAEPQPSGSFAYTLPVNAPVSAGLGAINDSGVRSRGLLFETVRGSPVLAPADGTVRFSGPFNDYDGIIILDHGGGWMTLIVNVSSQLNRGDKVRAGDLLGRALGPVEVELSNGGRRYSPALIAGSSRSLSNGVKGG